MGGDEGSRSAAMPEASGLERRELVEPSGDEEHPRQQDAARAHHRRERAQPFKPELNAATAKTLKRIHKVR